MLLVNDDATVAGFLVDKKKFVALVVQAPALAGQFIPGDQDRLSDSTLKPGALPLGWKCAFSLSGAEGTGASSDD